MGEDVALIRWLEEQGLAACGPALVANDVGLDVLPEITDADLAGIGLSLGMRRRLLKAAMALRPTPEGSTPPTIDELARSTGPAAPAGGERRHLTVMFCDVVDSTAMSGRLDAEEWRDLLASYHRTVGEAVSRMGGFVAQKLGDGAMVYFGYPQAHENDAERAVRAGLAVLAGLREQQRVAEAAGRPGLRARVGVHAGPVVMDAGGYVFGEVPNVAARVQTAAAPGELIISAPVHRQVAGLVVAEDRGPQALKGLTEPLGLFRVLRVGGAGRRRFAGRPNTQFVGRTDELKLLAHRWELARAGRGQLVQIVGEAGIGKSRLVDEFQSRLAEVPHTWVEFPCAQLMQNTPFHPVAEWGRQRFATAEGSEDRRLVELETSLRVLGIDPVEAVPLLAPMLELPLPLATAMASIRDALFAAASDDTPPTNYARPLVSPEEERRRQIATAARWILAGSRAQPMVVVVDDVQWADSSTLDLVAVLVERCEDAPLLVIVLARPEFRAPWPARMNQTGLAVAPMNRRDSTEMVGAILARHVLSAETIESVVARSGGVPLFLEEVTRLLAEGGDRAGAQQVPPTLQASLMARLDRLGPDKEVAQIGSVLGREFSWPLLLAVSGMEPDILAASLDRLGEADLIGSRGSPPNSSYRFNQALSQDAAYEALLKSRRRDLHRAAAKALAERFAEVVRARPELEAHHLTEAGESLAAIPAWLRAGEAAMARGAFVEASAHINRGIEVVRALPDSAGHAADEFRLRGLLAQCYWAYKGFAATETREAFEAALAVGEHVGDVRTLATVLSGLVAAMTQQGQFDGARIFADRLSVLAHRSGGVFERGWSALRRAAIQFYLGGLAEARPLFEEVSVLGAESGDTAIGGVSLTGMACIYRPWLAAVAGQFGEADAFAGAGNRWSAESGSPHERAFALTGSVIALLHAGELATGMEQSRELLRVTEQHKLRVLYASALLFHASLTRMSGDAHAAVEQTLHGIATYEAIGQKILLNWFLAMLAEAQADAGDLDSATVTAVRAAAANHLSPLYAPEVLRVQGEVLLRKAAMLVGSEAEALVESAEAAWREAVAEAKRTGAGLFELTAATALARLLTAKGRIDEARATLASARASVNGAAETRPWREADAIWTSLR
jgi:class 3 adenylate cyclase